MKDEKTERGIVGYTTDENGKRQKVYYIPANEKEIEINEEDSRMEKVIDTENYLPTSRAESGRIGVPQYDFKDGKDTGDRTRLRMTDKSLDITEADALLKSMERDISNKQKAEERAKAEKKLSEMKAKVEQRTNEILGITNTAESE